MQRVIAAFRLLCPSKKAIGPFRPSAVGVPAEDVGDFLDALYIAAEKLRAFGLSDDDFGGRIEITAREGDEQANGRYFPKEDKSVLFYPQVRGAPDLLWTIIHETMHRVWCKHLDKDAQKLWSALCTVTGKPIDRSAAEAMAAMVKSKPERSSLWFYFSKHFGKDLELFKQWLQTMSVSSAFPSRYANVEPAEAFSEVAANLILGRGRSGHEINRTGSMVRKVFLSLIEPLRQKQSTGDQAELKEQQDEHFLQVHVDFGYLRAMLPQWVRKNVSTSDIIREESRPHGTVYYGADSRDFEQIRSIASHYGRPIRVLLGELDVFEAPDHDVLFLHLVGDALPKLHKEVAALPHTRPPTHATYVPHLTLAYMKKGTASKHKGRVPFRMVVSARGLTVIDAAGREQVLRTDVSDEREPLLLATD